MSIPFKVLKLRERPNSKHYNMVLLTPGDWDDYSFKTSFDVYFYDAEGQRIDLGTLKIGYVDQQKGNSTLDKLPNSFESLPDGWFSLGQDVEYYERLFKQLSSEDRLSILKSLRDIVLDEHLQKIAEDQTVFRDSLMRGVSQSVIQGQFKRVLAGEVVLTDFHFSYRDPGDERHAAINLDFEVKTASKPSTNVHVLIGRNGVGKTTLLNNMVSAILGLDSPTRSNGSFFEANPWFESPKLPSNYFSSVVSVSFSAFDPFIPPIDQPDRTKGVAYFYVGMKNTRGAGSNLIGLPPKTEVDLIDDFLTSFKSCISQPAKRNRWETAIKRLESDLNFADMDLCQLLSMDDASAITKARSLAQRMSSGHSIVLLTITKLVDSVEEKTLVLLDEPESHLHPPLLSAFTRALADLLSNRNGVAIIATHSPVVVQEVPRSCVWKLTRLRTQGRSDRPERETFGENVGVLTREIFGLEVTKSGFHEMLQKSVDSGKSFEEILEAYRGQLGAEAKAILMALISSRSAKESNE